MNHVLLQRLVEKEGDEFQRIENRWKPTSLLYGSQVRALLRDLEAKFDRITEAAPELSTLDRRDTYTKLLHRLRLDLRQALFTWKADQLHFLQAITQFYTNYGVILRLLKFDLLRGQL